mgnify:CR=1 FL=1
MSYIDPNNRKKMLAIIKLYQKIHAAHGEVYQHETELIKALSKKPMRKK